MSTDLWNKFDPSVYIQDNYATIHDEDRKIIYKVDIGTGPNLYPAMLLLPYAEKIYCVEYSQNSIHVLLCRVYH